MALYTVAGLPTQVELPVPLIVDLLPIRPNVRSGQRRQLPGFWVQHETGNPRAGADAPMHNRFLKTIPNGTFVSFHFVVDDKVIYQMVPIDEVTWQAADGAGPGNMSGISCELCINAGINTPKSRTNAEALGGGILKALNMGGDRIKRHWDFNAGSADRHHCPDRMMNENYWPTFVANATAIINSSGPVIPSGYATPITYPWLTEAELAKGIDRKMGTVKAIACRRLWEVKTQTGRFQKAGLKGPKVGPDLMIGETLMGEFVFYNAAGGWILTSFGTRVFMSDLTESVVFS